MRFVIITGTSGAGKTVALHSFEDAAYYAVDNLPPRLLPALAAFCQAEGYMRVAVVSDARSGVAFAELPVVLQEMRKSGLAVESLFLDANDDALVQRYKETRRPHAMLNLSNGDAENLGITEAIQAERALLNVARALADKVIDTTALTSAQLRSVLHADYAGQMRPGLLVTVISFGFKYGPPVDADLMFDVRFLANPHYVPALQALDGRDERVVRYVHQDPLTAEFQEKMNALVEFALPQYQREGKAYLNIAIGCTGGKHRSVVLAEELAARLRQADYQVALRHRDIHRSRAPEIYLPPVAEPNPPTPFQGAALKSGAASSAPTSFLAREGGESNPLSSPFPVPAPETFGEQANEVGKGAGGFGSEGGTHE